MSDKLVKMLSTWFYTGFFPLAPGSMASIVATLMAVILAPYPVIYVAVFLVVTFIGFIVSGMMEDVVGQKDPGCVVIDEVSGVLISFFMLPLSWPVIIITFFLFRAFDMFKIYPVNKFEKYEGGVGIMLDDVVAGIYTNIVMHIAIRWAGIV